MLLDGGVVRGLRRFGITSLFQQRGFAGQIAVPVCVVALCVLTGCGASHTRSREISTEGTATARQAKSAVLTPSGFKRVGTDVVRVALLFPTDSAVNSSLPSAIAAAASEADQTCGSATASSKCLMTLAAELAQVPLQAHADIVQLTDGLATGTCRSALIRAGRAFADAAKADRDLGAGITPAVEQEWHEVSVVLNDDLIANTDGQGNTLLSAGLNTCDPSGAGTITASAAVTSASAPPQQAATGAHPSAAPALNAKSTCQDWIDDPSDTDRRSLIIALNWPGQFVASAESTYDFVCAQMATLPGAPEYPPSSVTLGDHGLYPQILQLMLGHQEISSAQACKLSQTIVRPPLNYSYWCQ